MLHTVVQVFFCFQKQPLGVCCKKAKFTGKHLCQDLFLFEVAGWGLQIEACNFIKKEFLAQVFSCEFQNTFFTEHFWTTISGFHLHYKKIYYKLQPLLIVSSWKSSFRVRVKISRVFWLSSQNIFQRQSNFSKLAEAARIRDNSVFKKRVVIILEDILITL